jgi:exo-beta-1,3-glucanase (GH17 family)
MPVVAVTASAQEPSALKECLLQNGLVYGPFRDGQGPDAGIYPTLSQIDEDLRFLAQTTRRIRIYQSKGPFGAIPRLAERIGVRVTQGVNLGRNHEENEEEIAAAVELAHARLIEEIVVGNEVLTGSLLSKEELIAYIRRVRREVPSFVPVGTAETWDKWSSNLDLVHEVDFVVAHFYPFWERHPLEGASSSFLERYRALQREVQQVSPWRNLRVVVGETGWPSGGEPLFEGVVPGPQNQRTFTEELVQVACANAIPFYLFEAFDEEWKWREGGSGTADARTLPYDRTFSGKWVGSSWGLFRSNGLLKEAFHGAIDQPDPGSRRQRDIFVEGQLSTYYDIGVDTSGQMRDWLTTPDESLKMSYPRGQDWGAVFITVGQPVPMPRPWKDFSEFTTLSLELKGEDGGEVVEVGIKDATAPDDGSERKVMITGLTTEYQQFNISLSRFASSRFVVPEDLRRLYVAVEFVFSGTTPQTVYARDIRYLP